ncbi:hypothetical protein HPB52_005669 [Rhipicephalus sanguineus]|uniref:Uncharacterized protein n=1 Tax=Rhipicephalus sanguineus TaxID=34632 RepID=A0A9D4PM58_RHISA|nr:hypothetical protein HPB52_005669 [Rhipicephalus sanguineus]
MLPSLCPPVKPLNAAYPRAWFLKLDAALAQSGVTAQPLMHAVLLNALPVELRHLAAASTSSLQPYEDLCAAVLICYGHAYRPLRWSREFHASPLLQRAVPTRPQPSLDHDDTSLITAPSTSVPATEASIPVPDHRDKAEDARTSTDLSNTRGVPSKLSAEGPSRLPAIRTSSLTSRLATPRGRQPSRRPPCRTPWSLPRTSSREVFVLPLRRLRRPCLSTNTTF